MSGTQFLLSSESIFSNISKDTLEPQYFKNVYLHSSRESDLKKMSDSPNENRSLKKLF